MLVYWHMPMRWHADSTNQEGRLEPEDIGSQLGRRERQIVNAVYRLGRAGVADIRANLPDPPSYSAVRTMLHLLEQKGHLRHERDGMRYVYLPVLKPQKASRLALRHLVSTFFQGSPAAAVEALLELPETKMSPDEKNRLGALIQIARTEGR